MKKVILATAVVALFTACHSTTEADIQKADSIIVKSSVDSVGVISDTVKSVKDSIK